MPSGKKCSSFTDTELIWSFYLQVCLIIYLPAAVVSDMLEYCFSLQLYDVYLCVYFMRTCETLVLFDVNVAGGQAKNFKSSEICQLSWD